MCQLEDGIADFIAFHFTLSDREDTPWRKQKQLVLKEITKKHVGRI